MKICTLQTEGGSRRRKLPLCEIAGLPDRNKVEPLVGKRADLASQLQKVEEQTVHLAHQLKHIPVTRHRRWPEYPMSTPAAVVHGWAGWCCEAGWRRGAALA